ncbi:LOW QUALITY PROTEIN: hypothetical protein BT93_F0772 [Corymbia citriodora subsp. variegata]|nr:LOW QUALITY PROTEIN: hypothetical protein BT93_F0772 [Corymbia citriodora subsp. variegata]
MTTTFSFFLAVIFTVASAQLSPDFYAISCPSALSIIQDAVRTAVSAESRMGASLLRLQFQDYFVNGCDGSVLLDDTEGFTGEKTAVTNVNSIRGFDVVDNIKSRLEEQCPGTVSCADIIAVAALVSCADIIAVAARDSLGGPNWTVQLGRRDSTTASLSDANSDIPSGILDLSDLRSAFAKNGFSAKEMVTLSDLLGQKSVINLRKEYHSSIVVERKSVDHDPPSYMGFRSTGTHSIGQARCFVFRTRIYNEENINPEFAMSLRRNCPSGDDNLAPLKPDNEVFDNNYFKNLVSMKGLLHTDQQLFNNGSTNAQVKAYSLDSASFFADLADVMVKMGNLSPLTGTDGEVRTNCRKINGS